jgi:NADH-quinone oxidoreductase subunit I
MAGLTLTLKHLFVGNHKREVVSITDNNYFSRQNDTNTIQYPAQQLPTPEVGRYQLDVEIDDCIVWRPLRQDLSGGLHRYRIDKIY